jgi:hypothetical protein
MEKPAPKGKQGKGDGKRVVQVHNIDEFDGAL